MVRLSCEEVRSDVNVYLYFEIFKYFKNSAKQKETHFARRINRIHENTLIDQFHIHNNYGGSGTKNNYILYSVLHVR